MKKAVFLIVIAFIFPLFLISCGDDDVAGINSRLDDLESAINNEDYDAFRACFHPDCDFDQSITEGQFNDLINDVETYSFVDRNISIHNSTADVNCTAEIDGLVNEPTYFKMQMDGSSWKIREWDEDNVEMFRSITQKP